MSDADATARLTLRVTLDAAYSFQDTARGIALTLRVRPLPRPDVTTTSVRIAIEPGATLSGPAPDAFGNLVDHAEVADATRLRVNADIRVAARPGLPLPATPPDPAECGGASSAAPNGGDHDWPGVLAAMAARWRDTAAKDARAAALAGRERDGYGPCEAFALRAVARLRALAIPTRLVGGYRLGLASGVESPTVRAARRHAWLAVWDNAVWRECDPLDATGRGVLLATAWGSSPADITALAGAYRGGGAARLTVNAHAEVAPERRNEPAR